MVLLGGKSGNGSIPQGARRDNSQNVEFAFSYLFIKLLKNINIGKMWRFDSPPRLEGGVPHSRGRGVLIPKIPPTETKIISN